MNNGKSLHGMTRQLFDALTALLPPKSVDKTGPNATLASCIEKFLAVSHTNNSLIRTIAGKEVHEAYCTCCLFHLQAYLELDNTIHTEEELLLSVSHLEKLKSCVEFLICLGVYPYLDPGVSIPLELRMEAHSYFQLPPVRSSITREQNLLRVAKCLLQFRVCRTEQLKRLASPALFLGDVIAALMQVGYSTAPANSSTGANSCSIEARQLLWKLLCDLPGSVAMKELLILQGGSSGSRKIKGAVKLPPAPPWLRKSCGRLLSRLLVRGTTGSGPGARSTGSDGVRSLLFASASLSPGVIGAPSGCITSLDPRLQPALAHGLAQILASKPSWLMGRSGMEQFAEDAPQCYFESIAAQILDLLTLKFTSLPTEPTLAASASMTDSVARFGALVSVATMHEFCNRDPALGKRLFLEPLLAVLYQCVASDASNQSSSASPSKSCSQC
ncbi:unnamed protein product [Echinostoma caproni]|uniref:THADA armadillo repeat containing n=1 Tax=Echinostoma caproni TaxID=27848 RepID=A0A183AQ43_9TREM|nr:unnamed protein product [Echinostoma caproni]